MILADYLSQVQKSEFKSYMLLLNCSFFQGKSNERGGFVTLYLSNLYKLYILFLGSNIWAWVRWLNLVGDVMFFCSHTHIYYIFYMYKSWNKQINVQINKKIVVIVLKDANLILTHGFLELVVLCTVICRKIHIPVSWHQNGHCAWFLQGNVTDSKPVLLLRRDKCEHVSRPCELIHATQSP